MQNYNARVDFAHEHAQSLYATDVPCGCQPASLIPVRNKGEILACTKILE
jgi:hypothetical protein